MKLPQVLQARRRMDDLPEFRLSAFACAVVQDGDSGLNGMHELFRVRRSAARGATPTNRSTVPIGLFGHIMSISFIDCEVAKMQQSEPSERDVAANGLSILGLVLDGVDLLRLELRAVRIRPPTAR